MTKEKLNAFFLTEEKLGERKINLLRLVFLAVFLVNETINYHAFKVVEGGQHFHAMQVMLAWLAYGAAAWYFINKRGFYERPVKYISAGVDAAFLTVVQMAVHTSSGALVPLYYILIVGCALRYSTKAILAASAFSVAGCSALWYFASRRPDMVQIPPYVGIILLLIMAMVGAVAGYVVQKMRGLVLKFAENYLRREQLEGALSRYVSHQVARKIMESPEAAAAMDQGRRTHAAILISDIRGFTPLSEGMDPAELVKLLNAYFTRMVDVVFRHDGTLDKFVGDALIVVFNDPIEQPDAERRAVACAADMQRAIAAFNKEQEAAGRRTLGVGVGVHCGPVVAGNIGSEFRMDYTVMGDTVNFTSRLQGKAPAGAVYVSAAVKAKTEKDFSYASAGMLEFKGYKEPAEAFRLA